MYAPPQFMTIEVFESVVAQFRWPAPYRIEDGLPDGILLAFPRCELLFTEGPDNDISVKFPTRRTGWPYSLGLDSVLLLIGAQLASHSGGLRPLGLTNDRSLPGSTAKVRNGIHDQCTIVLAYLQHVILGDYSWVEDFRQAYQLRRRD